MRRCPKDRSNLFHEVQIGQRVFLIPQVRRPNKDLRLTSMVIESNRLHISAKILIYEVEICLYKAFDELASK